YFSRRSLYIDYKSNIHTKEYMAEAARRRKLLYGLSLDMRGSGKDVMEQMKLFYHQLTKEDFEHFRTEGATYVMVDKNQPLGLDPIISNSLFILYKL
ncbi:MAG: hypothetical protein KDC53_13935, partial [Saprospiraceae bacterium]|nr:hypothetical protein [Saprospiraceae bacterium]